MAEQERPLHEQVDQPDPLFSLILFFAAISVVIDGFLSIFRKPYRVLDQILYYLEGTFLTLALLFMSGIVFADFVFREFGGGIMWSKESAAYLMIWVGFLGASIATRQDRHLNVELVNAVMPLAAKKFTVRLRWLITSIFSFWLAGLCWDYVVETRDFGDKSPVLDFPVWIVQLVMPVTMYIIGARFLGHFFFHKVSERRDDETVKQMAKLARERDQLREESK